MNINIHIERLILDGLAISQRQRPLVQAAVEAELSRLLAADGLAAHLQSGGALPQLKGDNIQLTHQSDPDTLGRQIARSVYSGIGGQQAGGKPQ
jgi:hypothetical protein